MNDKNVIARFGLRFGLLFALLLALASCENREYLRLPVSPEGTPIENPGRLHLSGIPEGHTARLIDPTRGNRLVATLSANVPVDVEEGTYTLLYISPTEGSGNLRSEAGSGNLRSEAGSGNLRSDAGSGNLRSDADYSLDGLLLSLPLLTADGQLPQLPDVNSDASTVTIRREQTHKVSLTPAPLTRAVQLDVVLQGTDMENIRSIEARLYGVRRTAQLDKGFAPQTRSAEERNASAESARNEEDARSAEATRSAEVTGSAAQDYYHSSPLIATSGSTTTADPTVSGTFRLLGIDPGTPQRIVIIATQTNDHVTTFEQDVSALFAGFNPPAAATTLRLAATLSFGIDEISGTINPWKPGWDEGGTGI